MKKKILHDDIDLIALLFDLWHHKIKIILITFIFFLFGLYVHNQKDTIYETSTNVKPILVFESQRYKQFNILASRDFVNIDSASLLDLFINKLQDEELIRKGIIKFDLINNKNLNKLSSKKFEEDTYKTAISFIDNITSPNDKMRNKIRNTSYWKINFNTHDKRKWKDFLKYLEKTVNEEIRLYLMEQIQIEIDILETQIKFKLEDIEQKISNAFEDYNNQTFNRIAFLEEQVEIARTLGIETNTTQREITEISYYLMGYKTIEKEINLIQSRLNENAFNPNLLELQKEKRRITQDQKAKRLKSLFSKTPINNKESFSSAVIDYEATKYKSTQSLIKTLSIFIAMGLIVSFVYVGAFNLLFNRK